MGAWGFLLLGEKEQAKKKILIDEIAALYGVSTEIVEKGFDLIEKEIKCACLQD